MHTDENAPDPIVLKPEERPVLSGAPEPAARAAAAPDETAPEPAPEPEYCRHCGAMVSGAPEGDWLCPECGRHQDSMVCPTCHQPVRASLMPAELRPEAANPQRRKKGKGE